jgi:hypothetical protein
VLQVAIEYTTAVPYSALGGVSGVAAGRYYVLASTMLLLLGLPLLSLLVAGDAAAAAHVGANKGCAAAGGVDTLNMAGGDLPGSPHALEAPEPALCAQLCNATASCQIWTYHAPACSGHGEHKPNGGICYLKTDAHAHRASNPCTCTGAKGGAPLPPAPPPGPPPVIPGSNLGDCPLPHAPSKAPRGAKNVLYILVDGERLACSSVAPLPVACTAVANPD